NEERLVRMKQARGFPRRSVEEALRVAEIQPGELDGVALAHRDMSFRDEVRPWRGWFEERRADVSVHAAFFRAAANFADLADRVPLLKRLYYSLRWPVHARRRHRIRRILAEEFSIDAPVRFHHHHLSHAVAAYRASGFENALVVTMDGGGDEDSSHVYSVRDGRWEHLTSVEAYDSLGNWYAYVTALSGFKAKKHEGKITGLAAHGDPVHRELLDRMVGYEDGGTVNRAKVLFDGALEKLRDELPTGWRREDLAASVQGLAEDLAKQHVSHWLERTGHTKVAVAGGIFANVRINQEVHELSGVEEIFVFPGMGDEGLSPGAAWALHDGREGAPPAAERLPDVYLGPSYDESEMEAALEAGGLSYTRSRRPEEAVAEKLAEGSVVARFAGRMEFGPRALGNRSILYQPTDPTAQDWLNERLDRTEFMPFAPAVLLEEADRCFEGLDGARDTARFMTITFDCTPWMRENCPGVVHVDGTARPQLVDRDGNPSFWKIIDAYRRRTGLPAIVNTSFNMHEEPIVCSPDDAIRAFKASELDYLSMGPFLAETVAERGEGAGRRESDASAGRPASGVG
ncbi:MAG: carbamoyltransferase C-terminal domain-containing protein, partial [Gemmatimonadota bacterium]